MSAPNHSVLVFLQTGYPSYHPTNSMKAMKAILTEIKTKCFKRLPEVNFSQASLSTSTDKIIDSIYKDKSKWCATVDGNGYMRFYIQTNGKLSIAVEKPNFSDS